MRKTIVFGSSALVMLVAVLLIPGQVRAGGCYEDPIYERAWHGRYVQAAFVRDNACMDGTSIIETVAGGTVVEVIGETDGWYKVRTPEGRTGWTGARLMEITSAPVSHKAQPSEPEKELRLKPTPVAQPVLISMPNPELALLPCPELAAGDLFKVTGQNAVYLLNSEKKRMYFPNSDVFHTWYDDFSDVEEIASKCFDDYPTPRTAPYGVNYRPGARLIKRIGSPSVHVVLPENRRARIMNADIAKDLYGDNWSSLVRDVDDIFWPNYAAGEEDLEWSIPHDGMLVQAEGEEEIYYVEDGEFQEVTEDLPMRLKRDVRRIREGVLEGQITKIFEYIFESLFADPAQEGLES